MAKYTLELRTIEEKSVNGVFDFDYPFYTDSELAKADFQKKFIQNYYFREIGHETVQRFKFNLKCKLDTIMPYYIQLYYTQLSSERFDFLLNKDYTETYQRNIDKSENENELIDKSSDNDINNNSTSNSDSKDKTINNAKESNLANGNASINLDPDYLTNVNRTESDSDSQLSTFDTSSIKGLIKDKQNSKKELNEKLKENYTLTGKGNIGITSTAELLSKWREVLINIDEMIINECNELFMSIY